jgi:predicted nucleic acid-binding protein
LSYLLDTNVLSETRRRAPDQNVLAWLDRADPGELFVSVLSIGEIRKGIESRRHRDARAAAALDHWLRGLETLFADRLVPIDVEVAETWGELAARETLPVIDAAIAATAKARGLTVVSRNVRDIARTGVEVVNPWQGA